MDYDSNYWKDRILAKYTTSLTKQDVIDSFKNKGIDITEDIIKTANSYIISIPYRPYGKPQTFQDILNKIDNYAKIYGFTHNVSLITKEDLQQASRQQTKVYKLRGSHRDERRIRALLGRDPEIHSGGVGKSAFCLCVTIEEYKLLSDEGFKIGKKPIR